MIDYKKIADAEEYYESVGYKKVQVPWTVTREISDITKPQGKKSFELIHEDDKVLVASAEQSFLYQYSKGYLPKGKFFATTPCFRKEKFDSSHCKYFIKTELIDTEVVNAKSLHEMINHAFSYFCKYFLTRDLSVVEIEKDKAYDINCKETELGSYGIRTCEFLNWVYGTGCAEPRLTFTRNKTYLWDTTKEK